MGTLLMNKFARLQLLLAATLVAACGDQRGVPAGADAAALQGRRAASPAVQEMAGVSHLPVPVNYTEMRRSLARHYPRQFVGVRPRTSVLVDVTVDETGFVRDVAVVDRPSAGSEQVKMVLLDRVPGSNTKVAREVESTYDPSFGPAAQAAIKDVRFHPAIRDGKPVPFTVRMSVEFTSPAA
jgi:hypothetical protein